MEPHIPDVEFFAVIKWIIILMVGSGLLTLASLIVKRWWYGNPKFNRRGEDDATRGWLDRYIALQKETNSVNTSVINKLDEVVNALRENGESIKQAGEAFKCNYEHRGR